jgi:hypothetical protein
MLQIGPIEPSSLNNVGVDWGVDNDRTSAVDVVARHFARSRRLFVRGYEVRSLVGREGNIAEWHWKDTMVDIG